MRRLRVQLAAWPLWFLLFLGPALSGCGWHLRGAAEVQGLQALAITGAGSQLRHELARALDNAGVELRSGSAWTLKFTRDALSRRTVATDARGRAAEKELRLELAWQLQPADDSRSPPPESELTLTRSFQYSATNATSTSDEAELVRENLYRDAARQILRQLEVTLARQPPETESADAAQP